MYLYSFDVPKYGAISSDLFTGFSTGMLVEDFKNKTIILKTAIT